VRQPHFFYSIFKLKYFQNDFKSLREKKYLAGEIDSEWSEVIKKDFLNWLNNYPGKLPMTKEELDTYLKERNY